MIDIPQLTKAQRRSIVMGVSIDGFTIIDTRGVELGMDKHGKNVYLAVIKRESDGQLFGIPWASDPNIYTIGDYAEEDIDQMTPIIPLWARTKTVTVYEGAGKSLCNLYLQL